MEELLRSSMEVPWSVTGAASMALAVALGAFGAHALRRRVEPDMLTRWQTANRYHMVHALGLFGVDVVGLNNPIAWGVVGVDVVGLNNPMGWEVDPWLNLVGWLFVLGTLLFSGSLYIMTVKRHPLLGPMTPLGGVTWIIAWITLAFLATNTG